MKLTSILMLCACLQVSAHLHSQTVSFSGTNVPIEKVFAAVEKQTGYVFFFDEAILKDARPVTIRAENDPLELFLSRVLYSQPFKFSFLNKTIVISRKEPVIAAGPPVADSTVRPEGRLVGGVVMDVNGTTLAGASVTVKGSGKSTITNGKGTFSIPVTDEKSKLVISYVGYNTREITLSEGQQQVIVQMTVAVNTLDEEVVQAYGKTSQRLAVGSIVKVSGEEIQRQPGMNPLLALNGRVPGLLVTPTSGYLSAPVRVEIRGRNTINPDLVADPLYVIDGVPLTILDISAGSFNQSSYDKGSTGFVQAGFLSHTNGQSPLFSINPADIESISVLKDAAATAIYGSRGANGVIIITTKRAQPGKTSLGINVQQGVSTAPRRWKMLNTPQYLEMRREALRNDGYPINPSFAPDLLVWDTTRYTDWQRELLTVAKNTDASISLSGGDRQTSFHLGAGYTNSQELTNYNGKNQRISFTSNLTHHSADQKLTVNLIATYSNTNVRTISIPAFYTLPPNAPSVFDEKGALNYTEWNAAGLGGNFPFSGLLTTTGGNTNLINASLQFNYNLAKGLSLGVSGGYNNAQSTTEYYNPIAAQNPLKIPAPTGSAGFGNTLVNNWYVEPQLNYTFYLGASKIECMAGGTYQNSNTRGTTLVGGGYTNDALLKSITNAPVKTIGENFAQKKYVNVHGRINYNWLNKYIVELTGNRDGSSNFGPGRQFGNFWSAGLAWIASEEAWAKRVLPSWWSFFKLNATYGVTGLDAGAAYQFLSLWSVPSASGGYPLYNGVQPLAPVNAVNQDYQWQENRKINVDLNLGFLNDKITMTVSWYRNRCNNQLTKLPTPIYTGFSSVTGNSPALVQNTGWEGMLNAKLISTKAFSWTLGFNISANRNILVDYPDFEFSPYYNKIKIGQPLNTRYLLHYLGINPQDGKPGYYDYNHDGVINYSINIPPGIETDDRFVAIDVTPKYNGGVSSQFAYKRCMLNVFVSFKKQMGLLAYTAAPGAMGNIPVEVFNDHWQQPGDQTRYTRFTTNALGSLNDTRFSTSDGAYADASFVRLANVAFSYSLSDNVCKKLHMKGTSISVNMGNLFTISGFKGLDPETSFGNLPQPRTIAGKISFTF